MKLSFEWRYFSIPAGSLPFSVGACLYLYKDDCKAVLHRLAMPSGGWMLSIYLITCALIASGVGTGFNALVKSTGLYISLILSAALIIQLYFNGLPIIPIKVDKLIGDYSYPTYVLHWQLGALASWLLYSEPVRGQSLAGLGAFGLSLLFTVTFSTLIIFLLDPALDRLRAKIKGAV